MSQLVQREGGKYQQRNFDSPLVVQKLILILILASTKTWMVDPETFHIQPGPQLNIARSGHSCSKMVLNDKVYLVVAGGYDEYRWNGAVDSVELLDPSSNKGWILGI